MDRKTRTRERMRRSWEELIGVMKTPMRYIHEHSSVTPAAATSDVDGEIPACKRRITSWEELVDVMNTPMRYPQFPELTSSGIWRPWTAEPAIQQSQSSTVEQPKAEFSSIRRHARLGDRQYDRPLQFDRLPAGHIRLLDLRKARMNDDILIGFKLINVPLHSAPKFVALSYCWGSTHLCTGIFVSTPARENQVYRVTENLAACLHSLLVLRKLQIRYLWIDQICINQENTDERNAQVRRMADIYKLASRVVVWLGQAAMFREDDLEINIDTDRHMLWRNKTIQSWLRVWAIFGRPWFFRQWVFQEAVFAQRISFLLGQASLDFAALMSFSDSLDDFAADNNAQKFITYYDFDLYLNEDFISWVKDTASHPIQNSEDLVRLLWDLNEQQCQDPRDKIFSLMGMVGNILPVDFVDYDRPAASVFQELSRHLIQGSGNLKTLTYLSRDFSEQRPTWVVHWGLDISQGLYLEKPSASLGRKWWPSLPVMEGQLRVSGRVVDSIATEVQSFRVNMAQYFESRFASVLRQPYYEACAQISHLHQSEHHATPTEITISSIGEISTTREPVPDRTGATLRGSFSHFFNTAFLGKEEIESDFSILIEEPTSEQSLVRLSGLMSWAIQPNSTLLVLNSGRLGLVKNPSRGPREGDVIAILHGLDVPCILRKSEDGKGWLFIADIYIHDIMHGEAVDWEEDEADTFILV